METDGEKETSMEESELNHFRTKEGSLVKCGATWTESESVLCMARANSSGQWGSQVTGQLIQVLKKPQLGFIKFVRVVEMSMPMTREVLRLIRCDSAFLVVVKTILIICSVTFFWIIAPPAF